jgi:hypothetical protein
METEEAGEVKGKDAEKGGVGRKGKGEGGGRGGGGREPRREGRTGERRGWRRGGRRGGRRDVGRFFGRFFGHPVGSLPFGIWGPVQFTPEVHHLRHQTVFEYLYRR